MATSYTYSSREIRKILKDNGYECVRTNGRHHIYSNGHHSVPVTINMNKMLALRILKQCNISIM